MAIRRLLSVVAAAGLTLTLVPTAQLAPSDALREAARAGQPAVAQGPKAPANRLHITVESIDPAVLTPGRPLELSGVVSNNGSRTWRDAQVYLEIGQYPAASLSDLEVFSESDEVFTTRVVEYGLFDEIGTVPAGTRKSFQLEVPYGQLPIIGDPGVYNVDVTVLAGVGEYRDQEPEARTRTLLPLLPDEGGVDQPAQIVTLLPLTAPMAQASDGTFVNDRLAQTIGFNGRLRNVLDFALNAPAGTLEIALDPALHAAVTEMSNGYSVKPTLAGEPTEGSGQESAELWLADLDALIVRQHVVLLPWGVPATSSLTTEGLDGVVAAAASSSQDYSVLPVTADVVSWEPFGSTRRAIATLKSGGAAVQIVSEASLPDLDLIESQDAPPPSVLIGYRAGTARAVVVRDDIAGAPIGRRTSPIAVRQYLMSEATVQSLSGRDAPVVVSLPFRWDPGPTAARTDLETGLGISTFSAQPIDAAFETAPVPYDGRVRTPEDTPSLTSEQFTSIRALRKAGRVYVEILNDRSEAEAAFVRQFAMAGSSSWESQPRQGRRLTTRDARLFRHQLAEITVGVPTFVALSSGSGPFPVTVANDLDVAVTVNLSVVPVNPALRIDPIDQLRLEPGQQRDVQVRAHAEGSGLTAVRVRLATPEGRRFGPASEIDVRATQIGVAIWIVMGIGVVVLVGAAVLRIIRRLRSPGAFSPREEPRHP